MAKSEEVEFKQNSEAKPFKNNQNGVVGNEVESSVTNTSSSSSSSSLSSSSSSSDHSVTGSLDGGWGWMVVVASCTAHVIADGCCYSAGVLYTEWLEVFGESKAKTSWVGALFVSMHAICGPIGSICTNKFGCRRTTIAGGLITAVGCIVSIFVDSIEMLCLTFGIIGGFGLALVYVPAVIVVAFYFEKKRAFATGIAVAGSGIGGFVFPPLVEFLIDTYSWRGTLLILGGIMLNIVLCGALFRPIVAFKKQKQRRRYLRSLERFSRVSSRRQSGEGLDKKSVCDHDEKQDCIFCQSYDDEEPISHSLVQFPTYLKSEINLLMPDLPVLQKHNSNSLEVIPSLKMNSNHSNGKADVIFLNETTLTSDAKTEHSAKKSIKKSAIVKEKKDGVKKEKKAHFPDHLVPRYRADIFYRGSLLKAGFLLNRGKSQSASCPDIFIHTNRKKSSFTDKLYGVRNTFRNMCDFSIFRSPIFITLCFHSMLLYVSYDIPYMYLPDKAGELGLDGGLLLSFAGIASTIGEIVIGYIADLPRVNCTFFYIAMISIAGISTLFVPILKTFALLATYSWIFGFFISANYTLTTIMVVELLGMEQLTNAYGFVSLSEGLANLVGVPLAGWVTDKTDSYDLAFYLSGAGVCLSGLILFLMPCLKSCDPLVGNDEESRRQKSPVDYDQTQVVIPLDAATAPTQERLALV